MISKIHYMFKNQWYKLFLGLSLGLMLVSTNQAYSMTNKQLLATMLPDNCYFSGDFKQSKKIKALPKALNSQGGFLYSCKLGLIWETQSPIKESMVFSTERLNFLVKDQHSAENMDSVQHDFLAKLLLGLMAADIQLIENEFELEISEADSQKSSLTLVPKVKMIKETIQSVILEKAANPKSLVITITDKNQQVTTINTNEVARYDDDKGFKTRCISHKYHTNACALLLDPERVRNN